VDEHTGKFTLWRTNHWQERETEFLDQYDDPAVLMTAIIKQTSVGYECLVWRETKP